MTGNDVIYSTVCFFQTDAYAPYLFDATVMWALTVNQTLQIDGNPRDGAQIYNNILDTVRLKRKGGEQLIWNFSANSEKKSVILILSAVEF